MAYKTAELEEKSLEVIQKYNLFFIEDVVCYLPCGKVTFYEHKLNELNTIKEALDKNKINAKIGLRKKWYKSDNATVQIALYRLICTEDERKALSLQEMRHSGSIAVPITGINYIIPDGNNIKPDNKTA